MSVVKNLPFEWLVGLRYTRAGKRGGRNRFISFIALISMAGIALGVAALIVVLSVMNGFEKEVTNRMLSVLAHVELYDMRGQMPDWQQQAAAARRNPQVTGAAPFAEVQGMLVREDVLKPAMLRGIVPDLEPQVSDVTRQMRAGTLAALTPGSNNIVLGIELARALDAAVGDNVTLAVSDGQASMSGVMPRLRPFHVVGIFEAGHNLYDASLAFIHLADAEQLLNITAPAGLRLRVADMQQAPQVARELKHSLPGELFVRDWTMLNPTWFAAVQSQKHMMFIILTMIVAVAAFNLVSTLVMTVTDKQADIAILRTLGASPRSIMQIFVVQGALSGIAGTLLGVALGALIALNVDVIVPFIEHLLGIKFLSKEIYFISALPSDLRWDDVARIGGVSVLLALVATLYPSWRAARVKPAQALRYE